jgi:hypothetical protein
MGNPATTSMRQQAGRGGLQDLHGQRQVELLRAYTCSSCKRQIALNLLAVGVESPGDIAKLSFPDELLYVRFQRSRRRRRHTRNPESL